MSQVRDAWDDDWESQADTLGTKPTPPPEKKVSSKVSKAQRRAQQAEFNRQLWAEAETPQTFHFVEARSDVPLKQDFKPTVTLLSRRPQVATRQSSGLGVDAATAGLNQLGLNGDIGDSDDEFNKAPEPTPEERQAIALKNLEEKQRKYEEVRERLFGSPSATTSGNSSPGSTTPPRQPQSGEGRGKGKGRGNGRDYQKRDSSSTSSKSRHLYDPSSSAKPNGPPSQMRERPADRSDSEKQGSPAPQQPTRHPRGPDASGRGGFKFNRGARVG
ncbi:hypothetical protein N7493_009958 [Penicillium malachiteum]|uniref:SUZ domain-containing protein n=1 Tax=Penicillium malachiteum TaxID=1324776 RepID=A0AAD6HDW5_9EURO|nr:hypothetical protein N7493_009958 [Penicillium malachiteum]